MTTSAQHFKIVRMEQKGQVKTRLLGVVQDQFSAIIFAAAIALWVFVNPCSGKESESCLLPPVRLHCSCVSWSGDSSFSTTLERTESSAFFSFVGIDLEAVSAVFAMKGDSVRLINIEIDRSSSEHGRAFEGAAFGRFFIAPESFPTMGAGVVWNGGISFLRIPFFLVTRRTESFSRDSDFFFTLNAIGRGWHVDSFVSQLTISVGSFV